jgi:hypothetical protein
MNLFLEKNPNYIDDIKILEEVTGKSILNRLLKTTDEINFVSMISEINFGKYLLKKFGNVIEFEPNIEGKKPDWFIDINNDKIIFEVLRINLHNEKLQEKLDNYKDGETEMASSGVFIGSAHLNRNDLDKVLNKEIQYRHLIELNEYKLVICIDATDWDKRIDVLDVKTSFDFDNKNSPFYHMNFVKNISGLIVEPYFGNIEFIYNQNVNKKLNTKNINILKSNS